MVPENLKEVGEVIHYYNSIGVAVIKVEDELHTGDKIVISGKKTDFSQYADSMEKEHEQISEAHRGESIGIRVIDPVRPHDKVYVVA